MTEMGDWVGAQVPMFDIEAFKEKEAAGLPLTNEEAKEVMRQAEGFIIKDSGSREQHDTGMVRDTEEGKADFTNLFLWFEPMGTRYATHMTAGRQKYPDPEPGVPNWTLAPITPELEQRFRRSASRHFKQWLRGDTDEDHAAAVMFNINGAEFVRAQLEEDA